MEYLHTLTRVKLRYLRECYTVQVKYEKSVVLTMVTHFSIHTKLNATKGITIFSKQAVMRFRDTEFTLLDTPGHVDFSTEMERTLSVLDYAIVVISGTDGIQNHTETLWRLLARYNVPTFIFVNKMDLNADRNAVLDELHTRFSDGCIDFTQNPENEDFRESLAMCDESIMNTFLADGTVKNQDIRNAVVQKKNIPVLFRLCT